MLHISASQRKIVSKHLSISAIRDRLLLERKILGSDWDPDKTYNIAGREIQNKSDTDKNQISTGNLNKPQTKQRSIFGFFLLQYLTEFQYQGHNHLLLRGQPLKLLR